MLPLTSAQLIERLADSRCERIGLLAVREVQAVHLALVPPLVEGEGGLVVFHASQKRAVNDHLKLFAKQNPNNASGHV